MSGPWEDFGGQTAGPWQDFSGQPQKPSVPLDQQPPQDLTFAEKYIAPLLDKAGTALQSDPGTTGDVARLVLNNGNARGAVLGRMAQGAADPGVAIAQLAANVLPNSTGIPDAANKGIQDEEAKYQAARADAGSTGFDPGRLVGQAVTSSLIPGTMGSGAQRGLEAMMRGGLQGAELGALNPVTDGGDNFWKEKLKETGVGAGTGAVMGPLMGALARVVSPEASTNANNILLRNEGVQPSIGQTLGGWANALEQKVQSIPFVGDIIQGARSRGASQVEDAAFNRVGDPIGATIQGRGHAGIAEASSKLGDAYDNVLPKLSVNVTDPQFVAKLSNLRNMVQTLPAEERAQFDNVISREIDGRVLPNGTLGGDALKDAWNALRDKAQTFSNSNDAYQAQLGGALKQTFQELKDHVLASNNPADVLSLRNTDFAYANFKRLQRAASSVAAEDGNFSPSQLLNAAKAMDRSKDKAQFATGNALMQDLASAGKSVLSNTIPDSGTVPRYLMTGMALGGGVAAPHVVLPAAAVTAAAYSKPVQNALRALVMARPASAPAVANSLRRLIGPATFAGVPLVEQGQR